MLAEERQNQILSLVKLNRSISITEIQQRLDVSRETIRRDLLTLAEQRKIRKTHGGAISLDTQEPEMAIRQTTNVAGKRAIGRLAAGMIPDGASVILAGGTTVQCTADELLSRQGLQVFTNCIATCTKLGGRNNNRVHILGGEIQPQNQRSAWARRHADAVQLFCRLRGQPGLAAISLKRHADGFQPRGSGAAQPDVALAQTVVVADHQKSGVTRLCGC